VRVAPLFLLAACAAETRFARVTLRADPSAELLVDGAPAGKISDYASGLSLLPGHHRFEVRGQVREAWLNAGDRVSLDLGESR
jgi:hypothetical protein